jgi:hypothetical protein
MGGGAEMVTVILFAASLALLALAAFLDEDPPGFA